MKNNFHQERYNYYYQVYLDEDNIEEFHQKLKNCTGKSLAISCEVMGQKNIQFMCNTLKVFPQFLQLKLQCSFKQLKDNGAMELSKAIKSMPNLIVLRFHLCSNSITDKGFNELSKVMKQLESIQHLELDFSQNKIEGSSCLKNLAQSLENKNYLVEFNLDISDNSLSKKTNIKPLWNLLTSEPLQIININLSQNKICENLFQQIVYIFSKLNGLQKYSLDLNLSKRQKVNKKLCQEMSEQLRSNQFQSQYFKINLDQLEFNDQNSFLKLVQQLINTRINAIYYSIIFAEDQSNKILEGIELFKSYLKTFQRSIYIISAYKKLISEHLTFCQHQHLYDLYS
ncbi:hypothetical protein ABPG73_013734 [Tetrahymena malaccensis]